uniref:Clathrin/coatomer adaptor adaptin-like N-terminal domain-containing protein n=1 Tax=Brassica oleracea TaxID=3712 RepID=A0A3P6F1D4_BRAOL|nr:unnamed protein product [Brassica oleracea]
MTRVSGPTPRPNHSRRPVRTGHIRLTSILGSNTAYDVAGITDPFLHVRLLILLRILGRGDAEASDLMNDILAQVASKTESNKNAGNAIAYECVQTIMSIEENGGLRLCFLRYVALNMLMRALTVDSIAVQRHRATILECVKDSVASIQRRALELIYLLMNVNNVKPLAKELIEYLELSEQDFTGDLTAKIYSIVEKFAPEKIWYIDQMVKVLSEAGNYVKDDVWHVLIVVISNAPDLHGYTVRALYRALHTSSEQETIERVAIWRIGEYADLLVNDNGMLELKEPITVTESDAVDVFETAVKHHSSDVTTKAMALIALLKISSRFPFSRLIMRVKSIIGQNKVIQKHQNIRSSLVEKMPVLDEATFSGRRAGSLPIAVSTSGKSSLSIPNGVVKAAAPLVDLLDLSSDDAPAPTSFSANC